jgi:hypothetical protein
MADRLPADAKVDEAGRSGRPRTKGAEMILRRFLETSCLVLVIAASVIGGAAAGTKPQPPIGPQAAAPSEALEALHEALGYLGEATPLSAAARIAAQESARGRDLRIYGAPLGDSGTRPVVEIVAAGGFHWADAGVGVGAAFAVVLLAFGAAVLVRSVRPSRA